MVARGPAVTAGEILSLIRTGRARTRAELSTLTGLSRTTLAERLDALFLLGFIREGHEQASSGGRPPRALYLAADAFTVLAADLGEKHSRLCLVDLDGNVLDDTVGELDLARGPEPIIDWIVAQGATLREAHGLGEQSMLGIGLAVPAPVDFAAGEIVGPSVMGTWEGVDIRELVRLRTGLPVVIENDVNARGLGELPVADARDADTLYVKVGTGIGSAIITADGLFRGSTGSAGDLGHIRLAPDDGPLCRCGAIGCVESMAAGWALVRDLREDGFDAETTADIMELILQGAPEALFRLRRAGQELGRAIAYSVSMLNPGQVVVGGSLSTGGDELLTGIRESVYRLAPPFATHRLVFSTASNDPRAGAVGVARILTDTLLAPEAVNLRLRQAAPAR